MKKQLVRRPYSLPRTKRMARTMTQYQCSAAIAPPTLDVQLAQWHQASRQQSMMPAHIKQQLWQQLQQKQFAPSSMEQPSSAVQMRPWRHRLDAWLNWPYWRLSMQGITAAVAVLFGWQLLYQHHQHTHVAFYQVQAYQSNAEHDTSKRHVQIHDVVLLESGISSAASNRSSSADLARLQQLYLAPIDTDALQHDQQQRRSHTFTAEQPLVAPDQAQSLVVSRQSAPHDMMLQEGWFLAGCDAHDMALTAVWLEHFQQQHGLSPQQWQQLQQSQWLQVTTGPQGQIIALTPSEAPPRCAP